MKKNVLLRSKRMAAIALSLSMVLGEGAIVGATELSASETAAKSISVQQEVKPLGKKVVAATTLADVTGLTYDTRTGTVSWNKVPGATDYRITYYDAKGEEVRDSWSGGSLSQKIYFYDYDEDTSRNYQSIGVQAFNTDVYYQWQILNPNDPAQSDLITACDKEYNSDLAEKDWNGPSGQYIYYKYPASANVAKVAVSKPAKTDTVLTSVKFKEIEAGDACFTVTPDILSDEELYCEYANNDQFLDDENKGWFRSSYWPNNNEISISLGGFTPGDTIYLRARVGSSDFSVPGTYVSTSYKVPEPEIDRVELNVTSSSVRLRPYIADGNDDITYYQYQRKNGKKWMDLGKKADDFTDKGLKSNTKYTYRVRGCYYNKNTKKTYRTDWEQASAYTWGSSLNLKASAASSKSVKLTWNKVASASGYEIYRCEGDGGSFAFNYKKDQSTEEFKNYKLIKTYTKGNKTSYTDKKLSSGKTYTYVVRAYRNVGKKDKNYIMGQKTIKLSKKASMTDYTEYYNDKGQKVVEWSKMTGISGYKVEKQDTNGNWKSYKNLKAKATSIKFPVVAPGEADVKYRIAPYTGKSSSPKLYNYYKQITAEARLGAVKGVKAVKTSDGGVKVTWKPVSGADYYRVYRATKDVIDYDESAKMYSKPGNAETVYETFYDVSQSTALTPVRIDSSSYNNGAITAKRYEYNETLRHDGEYLYNRYTYYKEREITGTSVVDKTATVQKLVLKTDDPAYNKVNDPEYIPSYVDEDGYNSGDYYTGSFGEYKKDPTTGALITETATMYQGPEAGNDYYYFVEAVVKQPNKDGATVTSSGFTKGAKISYTEVKVNKAKLKTVKSPKKGQVKLTVTKGKKATGCVIYRSNKKNGTYVQVGTTTGKAYTDTSVTNGKTYYYKVASYQGSENGTYVYSAMSGAKKVKVKK